MNGSYPKEKTTKHCQSKCAGEFVLNSLFQLGWKKYLNVKEMTRLRAVRVLRLLGAHRQLCACSNHTTSVKCLFSVGNLIRLIANWLYSVYMEPNVKAVLMNTYVTLKLNHHPAATSSLFVEQFLNFWFQIYEVLAGI